MKVEYRNALKEVGTWERDTCQRESFNDMFVAIYENGDQSLEYKQDRIRIAIVAVQFGWIYDDDTRQFDVP